ncbi:MAG TPA: hypothetical protein VF943_08965 [Burkholderiales bacterium]
MDEKTKRGPILSKLAAAEEQLQYLLDYPTNELNRERIMMAISLIKFERMRQETESSETSRHRRKGE